MSSILKAANSQRKRSTNPRNNVAKLEMENSIDPEAAEIHGIILPTRRCTKRLLNVSDTLLSLFVITPMVVTHWKGTWALMDLYHQQFPPLNCFLFGCMLHTSFVLIRDLLQKEFSTPTASGESRSTKKAIAQFLAMRIYTYVFSLGCNMHWRGGWAVLEGLVGHEFWTAIIPSTVCLAALAGLKSLRNLSAPPTFVITDSKDFAFSFPTRFRVKGTHEPGLYVLDCIFSVLVVGTLVVVAWRGIWVLLDLTLYPDSKVLSSWGSLIIGYIIVAVTFTLQPIIRWTCDRLTGFWRLAVADIFLFLSFVGTVNLWRGVWHLLDIYFLPDQRLLSDWITHTVSFLLLALLNCSNSVLVRGVYIDAEEPAGQCVVFPIYYIRLFFQKERSKKQRRLLDALEKQDQNNTTYLLDKQTAAHNNIKIVKNNANIISSKPSAEMKPMLNTTNEKSKNGETNVIKD